MKKRTLLFLCLTLVSGASAQAQNVGIGTITPDASAQLEVASINKGLLPPRMTTVQREQPGSGQAEFDLDFYSKLMSYMLAPVEFKMCTPGSHYLLL